MQEKKSISSRSFVIWRPVHSTGRISQATSYKYRLGSHSLHQSRRKYSVFSSSAKVAGGFKQLHNNLCMSFWMATEGIVFLYCSYVCNCAKNPDFANCRFSFRIKLQIFISQTTDSHFANYRFSFRFVPFRFVSQTTVSHPLTVNCYKIHFVVISSISILPLEAPAPIRRFSVFVLVHFNVISYSGLKNCDKRKKHEASTATNHEVVFVAYKLQL